MVVIDSSALIAALVVEQRDRALAHRLAGAPELHAPQLLDVELINALRRLTATGQLSSDRAQQVREDFAALRVRRYPHEPLSDRAWELRGSMTPSDAVFVVLAEMLEAPLVTCDPHVASVMGHRAEIEYFRGAP